MYIHEKGKFAFYMYAHFLNVFTSIDIATFCISSYDDFPSSIRLDMGKLLHQTSNEIAITIKKHTALDKKDRYVLNNLPRNFTVLLFKIH